MHYRGGQERHDIPVARRILNAASKHFQPTASRSWAFSFGSTLSLHSPPRAASERGPLLGLRLALPLAADFQVFRADSDMHYQSSRPRHANVLRVGTRYRNGLGGDQWRSPRSRLLASVVESLSRPGITSDLLVTRDKSRECDVHLLVRPDKSSSSYLLSKLEHWHYCSLSYSAFACFRMGTPRSASFQSVRKS